MHWTNGEHAKEMKRARQEERERCAKIADQVATEIDSGGEIYIANRIAALIRAQS